MNTKVIPSTVSILGSNWKIIYKDDDPAFEEAKGYANHTTREIVIENLKYTDDPTDFNLEEQAIDQKRVLRHEILHAFLFESGLADSSNSVDAWAVNEEMVDWFARQSPKIYKVYKELKLV